MEAVVVHEQFHQARKASQASVRFYIYISRPLGSDQSAGFSIDGVSGPFSLQDSAERLAVTLQPEEEDYPALDILKCLLRSTKVPLSSLLDGNWIFRRLPDAEPDDEASRETTNPTQRRAGAVIWLIPQEHLAESRKIIFRFGRENRMRPGARDEAAWCVGWM